MAKQPRRELTPPVPTTRTRNAVFQAYAKFAEILLGPLLRLQPLQPGKIARKQRYLQADPRRRS